MVFVVIINSNNFDGDICMISSHWTLWNDKSIHDIQWIYKVWKDLFNSNEPNIINWLQVWIWASAIVSLCVRLLPVCCPAPPPGQKWTASATERWVENAAQFRYYVSSPGVTHTGATPLLLLPRKFQRHRTIQSAQQQFIHSGGEQCQINKHMRSLRWIANVYS